MLANGWPGWAALSAGGIERLILSPLPMAANIIITADNDLNGIGERAARCAAERWLTEGRRVRIALMISPIVRGAHHGLAAARTKTIE